MKVNRCELDVINHVTISASLCPWVAAMGLRLFLFFLSFFPLFIFQAGVLVLLKNSRSLTMSVQLAAFNFIPAKFQSRPSQRPLTFGARHTHVHAHTYTHAHSFPPFSGITGRHCTPAFICNPGGQELCRVFWKYSQEKQKAAIFCLNISLTKSIDHSWVSRERGSEMERHVLFSNNSYLHPFLPPSCCAVVGGTRALFLGELPGLKLFYASAPRAPI